MIGHSISLIVLHRTPEGVPFSMADERYQYWTSIEWELDFVRKQRCDSDDDD